MSTNSDFDALFSDFVARYDAAGDAAKMVSLRCAAKVMSNDSATAAEIHAALALLDKMPAPQAKGPHALTVTFISPEPSLQEQLRERAERELAAANRRIAELERAVAALNRAGPSDRSTVFSLHNNSPSDDAPDWGALAAVNSRGGVTANDPNVRIKRLSDDTAANRIAR